MSAVREEFHQLVEQLSDDQVESAFDLVRSRFTPLSRRDRALATMARVQDRMRGVVGVDEEIDRIRDRPRD